MKLIINPFKRCYENIASEEFLVNHVEGDIFLLYINKPSIIVGNNQNTYAEINHNFVKQNNIDVVRRRSGGGAVYHDNGNLNFCFITKKTDKSSDELFKIFTEPVILALQSLGVDAQFSGRNDLTIDGKKFSGNAQWHTSDRSLIHGTMLFNSDLSVLSKALNASELKFVGKAIKSVRSRVTNIKPCLKEDISMDTFIERIIKKVESHFETFEAYNYSEDELSEIEKLASEKYATHEWTYGKSPKFLYAHKFKYSKGTVEVNINATKGKIDDVKIFGDFFSKNPNLAELENALVGCLYEQDAMLEVLKKINVDEYIDGLTAEELIEGCFS